MRLHVNGELTTLTTPMNVEQLLESMDLHNKRVAVMVNDRIVRRDERAMCELKDGDRIEIISMVGGG